jgi:predicted transposase/invertase (TIGR01784 family)
MSNPPPTAIDHDSIFKQLLTEFFVEFLDLFVPDALALLEPESLTFLDKESFVDLLDPSRREADLVVQARLRGQDASFIVHLEHQAQEDQVLDRRMFRYFARFYDRYDMPIYPIALCS